MRIGNRRPPPAPDTDLVRNLAALLEETGLSEIEYESSGYRIRVARGVATTVAVAPAPALAQAAAPPPPAEIAQANGLDHHPGAVTAPMVGVAYLAPQPGLPPFVKIGDTVTEGQTLLIIEAMKVMNQIRAPRAGRVAQVLVTDADAVEYGAALMLIE